MEGQCNANGEDCACVSSKSLLNVPLRFVIILLYKEADTQYQIW